MPPFELEVERLGKGGTGVGIAPDGAPMRVRFAPPGGRVFVIPSGKRRGVWSGRRRALVRPPASWVEPPCPVFALCGGCALQEVRLDEQRRLKRDQALRQVRDAMADKGRSLPAGVAIHPPRGSARAYGYRNKVELSFGPARYLRKADLDAGDPIDGRWLGFHAPGRFDRVVDVERCWLIDDPLNAVLAATRSVALEPDAPPPYGQRSHEGFWRHLVLRQGMHTGQVYAMLVTAPGGEGESAWVERWAEAVQAADLGEAELAGLQWVENPDLADVARGEVRRTWGGDRFEERLMGATFALSPTSFFQTSTEGARVLYETVGEALGEAGGTLLDLYCGAGTIGICLADRFDRVVGIEQRPEAVEDARANAARNGVADSTWRVGKVEDALEVLRQTTGRRAIVVDPPRPGLHPSVAEHLSMAEGEVLVYVACNPKSLGRDGAVLAEGGWRLTDLWTVDLFPQTGHVEMVGRFTR